MIHETIPIICGLLCVLLVIAIILRRKAKAKKRQTDEF
jgi:hypothetical protein